MRTGRLDILIAALCGLSAGSSFGWPVGWVVVLLALITLLTRLAPPPGRSAVTARRAATSLAIFVFCLYGAGHVGLPMALEPSLRPGMVATVLCFAVVQAVFAGLSGYVTFRLQLSMVSRLLLALPALWLLREWSTSRTELAAPWLVIGYAEAPDGPLAPLFPLGGVFLVSGATLLLSGAVALAIRRHLPRRACGLWMAAGLVAVAASGRFVWTEPSGAATVELVQSGAPPGDSSSATVAAHALKTYAEVVDSSDARLVVTPQLAVQKTPQALPAGYLSRLALRLSARNADALLGMQFTSDQSNQYYNGVAAVGASGSQRYLKRQLFPFGEFVPLPAALKNRINATLTQPRADAARGLLATEPLWGGGLRLAIAICYEIAFGDSLRWQAATADALVNISSDGTHDSLQLARQTKQIAQARALEFQKPVIRTSDVRGTFFIDPDGRVSDELPERLSGTVTRTVLGRRGITPYARWGDMIALGAVSLLATVFVCLGAGRRGLPAGRRTAVSRTTVRLSGQHGQALPMALALLVIVAGFFYFMVNAGQTVTEKIRVTNAADAAAYSAAVVEARALNYDAYLNRAMVANQMAIAQMVSFASWIDYFATAADGFGSYVTDINYFMLPDPKTAALEVAFGGSAAVAAYFGGSTVHEYADYVVDYGLGAIITLHDAATLMLTASQIAVQANLTAGIRQGQIAKQVVRAMDPKLNAEVVLVSHGFDLFTKLYSGDDRQRFADVATRSRSDFTRERNFTLASPTVPLVRKGGALKKRSGTDLVGLDEWRGVDTLELHGQRFYCGKVKLSWCEDVKTPIGWGAIEVDVNHGDDAGRGHHGNAYNENPTTARRADSAMRSPNYAYYSGIPPNQEIADTDPSTDESTAITILVTKSQSDTLTSGNAATVKPAGDLAVFNDHPAGGTLASLGRAQVYFDRIAARADSKAELGSLYNPYWRVRLVAPTSADRAYAATKQGGLLMPPIP